MKAYRKHNNILGWLVFAIASFVYIRTSEPTMSFWDCGEYISTAFKLEVGHPPGAPLFQMIGRFFSLFAGDVTHVARMVNTMSALCSGLTILFLFWTITMIAKKLVMNEGEEMTTPKLRLIMGAGLIGSLAYTFTDSFWFSAVEGEVYAMSSFFTAVVFWAIFKWEEHADEKHAYRWLLLIAYLVGLSIGVHLLNLLAIPAITFVWYFKKYPKQNWKGILLALFAGIAILSVVMYIIIPWIVNLAGIFELFFVNSAGMPFNSGTIIYFVILIGLITGGLIFSRRKGKSILNTIILAFTFIVIGYTSFLLLVIRSNANTPLDENNPENAMYLLSYLNREQYGDWPLFNGPYYNAPIIERTDGHPTYTKDDASGKYVITDKKEKTVPAFDPRFTTVFPRMWSTDPKVADGYKKWGKVQGVPIEVQAGEEKETLYKPTFGENLQFFWNYQIIHMYWRYLMWNFAGKQNDNQGMGDKVNGNWKCGIPFIDNARLGSHPLPEIRKGNPGDNSFYFLPFILGIIGIFFTVKKDYRSTIIIGLLFFMTGLAIVLYLNQYAPQPRERDYAYAGSFYAFAIWIGLGIIQIAQWLQKKLRAQLALVISLVFGVIVVGLMAQQGWDDHDRSGRYTSLALAENYLNSCAKDAILFTNGDNDTFPLWYAQEVEGFRTDVRVVNLSLLNADWCIDQIRRKAYDSDPVPMSMSKERYRTGNHDVTYFFPDEQLKDRYVDLKDVFDLINTDESKLRINTPQYGALDYFPTRKFMLTYDPAQIAADKSIPEKYLSRLDTIRWEIKNQAVEKNSLVVLDILNANNWKRPVYFVNNAGTENYIGLDQALFVEGLAVRVLPVKARINEGESGEVNTDALYDNLMNKFKLKNIYSKKVYLDEQNQRLVLSYRSLFGRLVDALILEGKKDSARKALDYCMSVIPDEVSPYDYFVVGLAECYYKIGDTEKADKICQRILKLMDQDMAYLCSFPTGDIKSMDMSLREDLMVLQRLNEAVKASKNTALGKDVEACFHKNWDFYTTNVYER
jgi:tetratricopeptide (TPR) repeat protein/MFS family permease